MLHLLGEERNRKLVALIIIPTTQNIYFCDVNSVTAVRNQLFLGKKENTKQTKLHGPFKTYFCKKKLCVL